MKNYPNTKAPTCSSGVCAKKTTPVASKSGTSATKSTSSGIGKVTDPSNLIHVTSMEQYHSMVSSNHSVVVLITSETCPLCYSMLKTSVPKFAREFPHVVFLDCDIKNLPAVAKLVNAHTMPAAVFLYEGDEFKRIDGWLDLTCNFHLHELTYLTAPAAMLPDGRYNIYNERDFFKMVKSNPRVVAQFYRDHEPAWFNELVKEHPDICFLRVYFGFVKDTLFNQCFANHCKDSCYFYFKNGKLRRKLCSEDDSFPFERRFERSSQNYKAFFKKMFEEVEHETNYMDMLDYLDDNTVMKMSSENEYDMIKKSNSIVVILYPLKTELRTPIQWHFAKLASACKDMAKFLSVSLEPGCKIPPKENVFTETAIIVFHNGKEVLRSTELPFIEAKIKDIYVMENPSKAESVNTADLCFSNKLGYYETPDLIQLDSVEDIEKAKSESSLVALAYLHNVKCEKVLFAFINRIARQKRHVKFYTVTKSELLQQENVKMPTFKLFRDGVEIYKYVTNSTANHENNIVSQIDKLCN